MTTVVEFAVNRELRKFGKRCFHLHRLQSPKSNIPQAWRIYNESCGTESMHFGGDRGVATSSPFLAHVSSSQPQPWLHSVQQARLADPGRACEQRNPVSQMPAQVIQPSTIDDAAQHNAIARYSIGFGDEFGTRTEITFVHHNQRRQLVCLCNGHEPIDQLAVPSWLI
jgi:hypothetical protein